MYPLPPTGSGVRVALARFADLLEPGTHAVLIDDVLWFPRLTQGDTPVPGRATQAADLRRAGLPNLGEVLGEVRLARLDWSLRLRTLRATCGLGRLFPWSHLAG